MKTLATWGLFQVKEDHDDWPCWTCHHYGHTAWAEGDGQVEYDPEFAASRPHP